jgi:tetratricopeptide (TPR) repeat protein
MNRTSSLLASSLALCLFAGCETERVHHVQVMDFTTDLSDDDAPRVTRLKKLQDRVEKDPKDAAGWFALGEYYETGMENAKAIDAYQHGNALIDVRHYTGGNYLLARMYLRIEDWDRSIFYLNQIFALEDKDPKRACLNPHFREAHYLRGAIYFLNKQYQLARREFIRFTEIGGDENRVEDWLMQIHDQGD